MTPESLARLCAAKVFDLRSKGRSQRTVEAHVTEPELVAIIAAAVQLDRETRVVKP